jgi:hypothetical protein
MPELSDICISMAWQEEELPQLWVLPPGIVYPFRRTPLLWRRAVVEELAM